MADRRDPRLIIGAAVESLRTALGWTQRTLEERSGVCQSMISRIERGLVRDLTLGTASTLVEATGARLVIGVEAPYLADRARQHDAGHARLAASVVRRLRSSGWDVRTEVEVGGDRSRGWIDVLAFNPATGVMLVIELKTEIHDLGQIERSLGWYEREAWLVGRRFGWQPTTAMSCLLLLMTEANDARAAANRRSINLGFRFRARDLVGIVGGRIAPDGPGRAVAMVDPRSKRRAWCRAMRIDGRRTAAPYSDYADFVRAAGMNPGPR
jgi:transcriptional regulator with XRE-family HTH domain